MYIFLMSTNDIYEVYNIPFLYEEHPNYTFQIFGTNIALEYFLSQKENTFNWLFSSKTIYFNTEGSFEYSDDEL